MSTAVALYTCAGSIAYAEREVDAPKRGELHLTAPFVLTRELARPMLERGYGKIIFTASLLSFQGGINVPSYTAAKSGVVGLTKALSNEWSARGVNVNAITPTGYIATDNPQALQDDPDSLRGHSGPDPGWAMGPSR